MLEAFKIEARARGENFCESGLLGGGRPRLGNNAVQVPEVSYVDDILKDFRQRAEKQDPG